MLGDRKDTMGLIVEGLSSVGKKEKVNEAEKGTLNLEKTKLEDYVIKNYKSIIKNRNVFTFTKDFYCGTTRLFDGDSPALVAFYRAGCVKGDKIIIPKGTKFFMSNWDKWEGPVFNIVGHEDAEFGIMDFDNVYASIDGEIYDINEDIMFEGKKLSNEQIKWLFANGAAVSKGDTIEIDWDKANKSGWKKKLGGPEAETPNESVSEGSRFVSKSKLDNWRGILNETESGSKDREETLDMILGMLVGKKKINELSDDILSLVKNTKSEDVKKLYKEVEGIYKKLRSLYKELVSEYEVMGSDMSKLEDLLENLLSVYDKMKNIDSNK